MKRHQDAQPGGFYRQGRLQPEFGGRPTTEAGMCPPARNPWNLEHTGGGSAAARKRAADGLGSLAQGSDGGEIDSEFIECLWSGGNQTVARESDVAGGGRGSGPGFATFGTMAR